MSPMVYFVILYVFMGLVTVPLLAVGILSVIGLFRPDIRKKGIRQLRQPFVLPRGTKSEYALHKDHRRLEDEVIRRYGQDDRCP